tara:strand:- start:796 stop:1023 length:228 start_codon:yes stop_codon:yes gene_type:complete
MDNIRSIVSRLKQIDERFEELKNEKKGLDEEAKMLEEELICFCEENGESIESVTRGEYNVKEATGRKLKKLKSKK